MTNHVKASSFRKLMNGHKTAEIVCPNKEVVVRRLKVEGNYVEVDALTVTVKVHIDTPITFEEWFMDRGSLLFRAPGMLDLAKICTEYDVINYPDGTTCSVVS